ncbi:hypothetical protein ACHAXA_002635 [Cyclostephanos tholiformis]|uniref:Uncharacterized protein n=1 Tax=Cyclostephanos tholiformis TaxID=382380 RepID=A0ABD3SCQ9_9STRA
MLSSSSTTTLRCTGVPDADVVIRLLGEEKNKVGVGGGVGGGGFAPPIRELPRGQLVPPNWEANSSMLGEGRRGLVAFCYYRVGRSGGAMTPVYLVLRSSLDDDDGGGGICDFRDDVTDLEQQGRLVARGDNNIGGR